MVLVHYKFDTNKETKELTAALLANNNFICQDYRIVTKQYIFTKLNVVNMFSIA